MKPARETWSVPSNCRIKRAFPTKKEAKRAAKQAWKKRLRCYLCQCGYWHLTSGRVWDGR